MHAFSKTIKATIKQYLNGITIWLGKMPKQGLFTNYQKALKEGDIFVGQRVV